jgi:hypothetical protein
MRDLLVEANDAVRKARQQDATALAPPAVAGFVTRYWEAVRAGLVLHRAMPPLKQGATRRTKRRPGHNLLERLKGYKDDVLRFLYDFTNNLAEQDLRLMKVKMKSPVACAPSKAPPASPASAPSSPPPENAAGTPSKLSSANLTTSSRPSPRNPPWELQSSAQ